MKFGSPLPRRRKTLKELEGSSSDRTKDVPFKNDNITLKVHTVSIDLLKYRLNNGRTLAAQKEYLEDHPDLPDDFFKNDFENEEAQKAQHEILKSMMGESGLLKYFKKNKQVDPLIVTQDGFVVNGNRRLCAMRELFESDSQEYSRFSHVYVVILPPSDEKDIDELEARLQVHPDIKADYTWTARALMLKTRKDDHDYTENQLAQLYEMKVSEVREFIDMLGYAESYLEDRDKSGHLPTVDRSEFAFRQLRKNRDKLDSEPEKEVFEKISYCLIDKPEDGRVYDAIPDVAKYFNKVIEKVSEEFELGDDVETESGSEEDLLGGGGQTLSSHLNVLDDESNHDKVRDLIADVIQTEKIKDRQKKKKTFVIDQIRRANTNLTDAVYALDENTEAKGIDEQLIAIEDSVKKIRQWLDGQS